MATLEQIERALHNAHNAGDEDAARQLAAEYKKLKSTDPAIEKPRDFLTAVGEGVINLPESAIKYGKGVVEFATTPIDKTIGTVTGAMEGGIQNLVGDKGTEFMLKHGLSEEDNRKLANAVGEDYKKAYGGWDEIKNTIATDPVRVIGDLSVVGGLAGKATGINKLTQLSNAIDPMQATAKATGIATRALGKGAGTLIGELGTHTGSESLKTAARAGIEGGNKLSSVLNNMRGAEGQADIVPQVKQALREMRNADYARYKAGMGTVKSDPAILDFSKLDDALSGALETGIYRGRSGTDIGINVNKAADTVKKEVTRLVSEFRKNPKEEFHTAEGFDELKRGIGNILDKYDKGTPQYRVAKEVYDAAKTEIVRQAPGYAKVMKDSQQGMELTKEIERSLAIGDRPSADTALRRLQGVIRNNANTNYGSRVANVELLDQYGSGDIMEKLAGQSLNTWAPRGLGKLVASGVIGGSAATLNPGLLALLPFESPRIMGETAVKAGQAYRGISKNKMLKLLKNKITPASIMGNALIQGQSQ
jgi:hypothetical protein